MGKGAGKGSGKPCCEGCCKAACVISVSLVCVLLLGLGFVGGGIAAMVATKVMRSKNIKKVEDSITRWDSATNPDGWPQFQRLAGYVTLTPGSPISGTSNCSTMTLSLNPNICPYNEYLDEAARFRSARQLAFCAYVPYNTFVDCDLRVSFTVVQGGSNVTLTTLPDLVDFSGYRQVNIKMMEIRGPNKCSGKMRCSGSNFNACARKCSNGFGGMLSCSMYTCSASTAVSDLSVKVTSTAAGSYALDSSGPVFSRGGDGGNVLPSGFSWPYYPISTSSKSPRWQYDGMGFHGSSGMLTLTLRSSADPWLTYMAATNGSGYFDTYLKVLGGVLIGIGCLILLVCLTVFLVFAHARTLAARYPERPPGCYYGCMWRMGRGIYGPRPGTAAAAPPPQPPLQADPPVAQPVPGTAPPPGAYSYAYGAYPAAYTPGATAASPQQQPAYAQPGGYAYGYPAAGAPEAAPPGPQQQAYPGAYYPQQPQQPQAGYAGAHYPPPPPQGQPPKGA
ncbi:hypothetical protein Agub_g14161 [Astrephomene gubernaculifera]|uniref:Uncharacterized protein n=1 Tax=Astrephomene gubernaculifera TaxID=47775 RepID=A0AAD3E118_9CHLO|nr:hypothetical protein Agub_g14161 [Astrephomene gubernaculifera]